VRARDVLDGEITDGDYKVPGGTLARRPPNPLLLGGLVAPRHGGQGGVGRDKTRYAELLLGDPAEEGRGRLRARSGPRRQRFGARDDVLDRALGELRARAILMPEVPRDCGDPTSEFARIFAQVNSKSARAIGASCIASLRESV
jgi:hypothetical protein